MKIYLASFLEPQNFGPGRIISISYNKPKDVDVAFGWEHVTPDKDLIDQYNNFKLFKSPEYAAKFFEEQYCKNLDFFTRLVEEECKNTNSKPIDILGLEDSDTLCSWERSEFSNYRKTLAKYLINFGYEVILK